MGWQKVALDLARAAQIDVPLSRLVRVLGRNVLVTEQFDRVGARRVAFINALTMLEARDGSPRSYLEVADVLQTQSPAPGRDLEQLFRRVVFSILVSNTDDHLRIHGFLRETTGWTLSPAYDLNPNPEAPGTLSTTIGTDGDPTASIGTCVQTAPTYRLTPARAIEIVDDVERATSTWRVVAMRADIAPRELDLMVGPFDTGQPATARTIPLHHLTVLTERTGFLPRRRQKQRLNRPELIPCGRVRWFQPSSLVGHQRTRLKPANSRAGSGDMP
jgi:serine/threonine-protein kinase HipA